MKVTLPVLKEQEKISGFLSAWDKLIEKQKKKIELLKELKKGYMQKIFNRVLRFKDESGNNYPDWKQKVLGDVCSFSKGKNISKNHLSKDGLECIRYGELYTFYKELIDTIKSKTYLSKNQLVLGNKNDLLIPASGETREDIAAASCLKKDNVAIGGDINILRSQENSVFLAYYLNNAKKHDISRLAQGASILHLYKSQLQELKISLPVIGEQEKIANMINHLDKKINAEESFISKCVSIKKGYLQRLFAM